MTIETARTMTGMTLKKAVPATIALLLAAVVALIGAPTPVMQADSGDSAEMASTAPSGLTATLTDDGIALAWTPGTTPTSTFQRIDIHVVGADPPWSTRHWIPSADMNTMVYPRVWLAAGRSYTVQVLAMGVVNGDAVVVNRSNVVTVAIPAATALEATSASASQGDTSPTGPGGLQGEAADLTKPNRLTASVVNRQVRLAWTPGTNPNYTSQTVKRREVQVNPVVWTDVSVGVSDSSYTDTTARAGVKYIYRIRASRSNGYGALSNQATVVIPGATDPRDAANPSVFRGIRGVALVWTNPSHPRFNRLTILRRELGVRPISWTDVFQERFGVANGLRVAQPGLGDSASIGSLRQPGKEYINRNYVFRVATIRAEPEGSERTERKTRLSDPVRVTLPVEVVED